MVELQSGNYREQALADWKHRMMNGWGSWYLDTENPALVFQFENIEYDIPLEKCNTSAQILDWVYQIYNKSWAKPNDVYNLLRAFNDIADVQHFFCSFGIERAKGNNFKMVDRVKILYEEFLKEV